MRHERNDLDNLTAEPESIARPSTRRPVIGRPRNKARTQANSPIAKSVGPNGTDTDISGIPETPLCHSFKQQQPSNPKLNGRLRPPLVPNRRHSSPSECPEFHQGVDLATRGMSRLTCADSWDHDADNHASNKRNRRRYIQNEPKNVSSLMAAPPVSCSTANKNARANT